MTGVELIERLCAARGRSRRSGVFPWRRGRRGRRCGRDLGSRGFPDCASPERATDTFADEETTTIVAAIRASGARLLFVGLGSPRQELWLAEHLRATGCGAGIGVGGSFDVIARPRRARAAGVFGGSASSGCIA